MRLIPGWVVLAACVTVGAVGGPTPAEAQAADCGTITETGLYTAPAVAGTCLVIASVPGAADTAVVTVAGCISSPTVICPGDNWQAKADAAPSGAAFTVIGTHRNPSVTPKANQQFVGLPGAVMDGGNVLTGWTQSGAAWYVTGQTQQGTPSTSTCQTAYPGCGYPEQLWANDTLLRHVTSLAAVNDTSWYFDYSADRIYIGRDPTSRTVVTSLTPWAFGGSATGVTVKGLTIQHYATSRPDAVVNQAKATGWTIENDTIQDNAGQGAQIAGAGVMRGNVIRRSGQTGWKAFGTGGLIYGNEFAYNNTAGFGPGTNGEAGAGKAVGTTSLIFRQNNSHDNDGPGVWFDIDNRLALIDSNTVTGNKWRGIFYEISCSGTIAYNTVTGNGFAFPSTYGAFEGAGILVSNSQDVEVKGNVVSGNYQGIMGRDEDRGTSSVCGLLNVINLSVHDNTVTQTGGGNHAGGVTDTDPSSNPYAQGNVWANNTYTVNGATRWRWTGNSDYTWTAWTGFGQDAGSTGTGQ